VVVRVSTVRGWVGARGWSGAATSQVRMSWRGDLVTVLLSLWLIVGIFVDGWAHNTQPGLETFFTPWHALFYSGFAATAAWVLWSVWSGTRDGRSWPDAVPVGYGYAMVGLVIFGVSGLGDLTWHEIFGIEQNIGALLSPTHLGLFAGAFLVVTAPYRSAAGNPVLGRDPGLRRLLPAVMALTLAGCLSAFILQAWHPMTDNPISRAAAADLEGAFGPNAPWIQSMQIKAGVASFLLATVFLYGPLVYLARTWRVPPGAAIVVIGVQCVMLQAMLAMEDGGLAVLGVLGSIVTAALVAVLRPGPDSPGRIRAFAGLAPPLFWGIFVAGIALADKGLGWQPEWWGGSIVWSALVGLAMTLVLPPRQPVPEPSRAG
jgi:hypothetical protein